MFDLEGTSKRVLHMPQNDLIDWCGGQMDVETWSIVVMSTQDY